MVPVPTTWTMFMTVSFENSAAPGAHTTCPFFSFPKRLRIAPARWSLPSPGSRNPPADHMAHKVEVAGAYLALMSGGGIPVTLHGELPVLKLHVGRHSLLGIAPGQLKHRGIGCAWNPARVMNW